MRAVRRSATHSFCVLNQLETIESQRLDRCQNLRGVTARRHVLEHVSHDACVVDHERGPLGDAERTGDAESFQDLGLRIGDKPALEIVFLDETAMRIDRIFGNPDERCARPFEVSGPLTELDGFDRSARRIVFRIRPQHDVLLPAKFRKVERPVRGFAGDGDHRLADDDVRAHGMTRRTWKIRSAVSTVSGCPATGVRAALSTHEPTWSSWM